MASRRRAREYALQALYESDLASAPASVALEHLWAGLVEDQGIEGHKPPEEEEIEFARQIVLGVDAHRPALDEMIEGCSTNWRLVRMPVVDRNILRIAAFELAHCRDIPPTVSINEAVELAKRFGTAESKAFVNGIVDRLARKTDRLAERPQG